VKERRIFLLAVVAVWIGVILVRLYGIQVRDHDDYVERARRQQQRAVTLDPPRGIVYDARGRELAVSVEVASLAATPSQVEEPEATAEALASVLDLDAGKLAAALAEDREFLWIRRKLDPPDAERVRALGLQGVYTLPESKRYYPMRELAAQLLGYVGTDNVGLAGLEYRYDSRVAGEPGKRTVVRDARSGTVLHPGLGGRAPRPGRDLHLTLDAAIQNVVERELRAGVETSGAERGMAVVMDPESGAILAMASYPTFDPNRFAAFPKSHWRNQPVMDTFEPGSTFKMVTLAAALEANRVDPLEKIDCGLGGIVLNGVRINDHHPFGELTTREIIARSSNVGAIKLGLAAGRERLHATLRAFGFGRPTGVDLPSESAGIVHPLERWSELSPAYVSFGQGLSVTALQLTNAFAAIANGGYLLRPYLVRGLGDGDGGVEVVGRREVVGVPISPSSVIQVRSMLESVVLDGTARAAAVPGYRAAGKTGTAEKAVAGRGYAADKYVASFVGFAPIERPALVAAVVLDEPWPRYHGGEVAAPIFGAIARQVLLYLGVPRDGERPPAPATELPEVRAAALEPPMEAESAGDAVVAARQVQTQQVQTRETPPGTVPDLAGLPAREAVVLSTDLGLHPALNGHGRVARQMPPPGTPLEAAAGTVELWLAAGGT